MYIPPTGNPKRKDDRKLTPMQQKVLDYFLENGANNPEIAKHFGVSLNTITVHFHNIYIKTGYSSRMELVVNILHKQYQAAINELKQAIMNLEELQKGT